MYDAGSSMLSIQKELGAVSVANIRKWSVSESKQVIQEKIDKEVKKWNRKQKVKRRPKKLKKQDALVAYAKSEKKKEWKKRVFAGWKDTPEQAAIRCSPEYQEWRRTVLERDNYTCQHCEKTGGRLVVHHIKTFKMNIELRMDPDNGVVLCNKCHETLHLSRMKQPKIVKFA